MVILLCTAEELMLTTLEYRFRKHGWRLEVAKDARQAGIFVKKLAPDLVIVDLELPEYEGLDIIQTLHSEHSEDLPLLATAQLEEESLLMEALRLGAHDFIIHPYKPDELVLRIRRLLQMQKVAG